MMLILFLVFIFQQQTSSKYFHNINGFDLISTATCRMISFSYFLYRCSTLIVVCVRQIYVVGTYRPIEVQHSTKLIFAFTHIIPPAVRKNKRKTFIVVFGVFSAKLTQ